MTFGIIIYPIIMLIGYLFWKRSGDKEYYLSLYPLGVLFFIALIQSLSESLLVMSPEIRNFEFYLYNTIRVLAGIALIIIFFSSRKK